MARKYKPCKTTLRGSTAPLDPEHCKAGVTDYAGSRIGMYRQCLNKAKDDGWCHAHTPRVERRRAEEADARYKRELDRRLKPSRDRETACRALRKIATYLDIPMEGASPKAKLGVELARSTAIQALEKVGWR